MDVFGALWKDHPARMAAAWDAAVAPGDTVLVPGDVSWARDLAEAHGDLQWIGERPGVKLLLRGNHDGWWTSIAKVRKALPDGCHALQNDAFDAAGKIVVGARGWTAPVATGIARGRRDGLGGSAGGHPLTIVAHPVVGSAHAMD